MYRDAFRDVKADQKRSFVGFAFVVMSAHRRFHLRLVLSCLVDGSGCYGGDRNVIARRRVRTAVECAFVLEGAPAIV